jgi:N-acetylglucosaminyl-diphospho-decaprenol L-rhamnosyltransferase
VTTHVADARGHALNEEKAVAGDDPLVSVIVVTWNVLPIIGRCLREVFASKFDGSIEVIVVDNASADGTADFVATEFPGMRLVRNPENGGFAGGNNQGFALARGKYCLLINPDAFPSAANSLGELVRFLETHEEYAAVGCKLVFPDGRHQVGDAGYRPSIGNVARYALGLSQVIAAARGCFISEIQSHGPGVLDVDWICGACMLVRRRVIEEVGGLDPDYFLYGNDLEWGCRMRNRGLRLGYLRTVSVIHLQGWTGNRSDPKRVSTRWLNGLGKIYVAESQGRNWGLFRGVLIFGFALRAAAYALVAVITWSPRLRDKARAMWLFARHVAAMSQGRLVA